MSSIYKWLNEEKSRYYTVTVQKEFSNQIVMNYSWGSCNSKRGGTKNIFLCSYEEVIEKINKLMKRRKSRGYQLISPPIKQIGIQ